MDLVREPRHDGVWLVLPPRQVPAIVGWGIALFGAAMLVFMVFWIGGAAGWGKSTGSSGFDLARWIFAAFGLPGLFAGLAAVAVGLGLALGVSRCEVGVGRGAVLVRERLGRLRWTRRLLLASLRGIVVPEVATRMGGLRLRRAGAGDITFAPGYAPGLTAALAAQLQAELDRAGTRLSVLAREGLGPPPGTLAVEEADGRLAIRLLPTGRPWGLLGFAILWLGAIGFISVRTAQDGSAFALPGGLILLAFWAFGLGLLLLGLHLGWRRVDLLWADGRLTVLDGSPLRRRSRSWTRDELADVLVEEHGSGSGRYEAVTIRPHAGTPHELPQLGDAGSKAWIAGRLRLALRGEPADAPAVPAAGAAPAASDVPTDDDARLPPGSPVSIDGRSGGVRIVLPPRGLVGPQGLLPVGVLFALFGAGFIALVFHLEKDVGGRAMACAICGLFIAIGLALAWHGLRTGTRRTVLALGRDGLEVERSDLLGTRRWQVPIKRLGGIAVEDSGTRINDRTLWRLAIEVRGGERITLGGECSREELAAVAAALRRAARRG